VKSKVPLRQQTANPTTVWRWRSEPIYRCCLELLFLIFLLLSMTYGQAKKWGKSDRQTANCHRIGFLKQAFGAEAAIIGGRS